MVQRPNPRFRRFAHAVTERGIDLVHGHSAHVCQGAEVHNGRLILYDTGDILDDYAIDPVLRNDQSFLFLVDIHRGAARNLRLIPVQLGLAVTRLAPGDEVDSICTRMQDLSSELGLALYRTDDRLIADLTRPQSHPGTANHGLAIIIPDAARRSQCR
jgi:poly-gamma-glutamate synthesis protein (capsule biosynthesis protein)